MDKDKKNFLTSALEQVYGPLIQLSAKLPAPLAYGLAVLVALIVAFLVASVFGATLPAGLLWLIFAIVFLAFGAFIITDWNTRQQANKAPSTIDHTINSSIFYVVVHAEGDQTNVINDAEVTLALPEPVIKKSGSNGSANFTIPNEYIGKEFAINARKVNYKTRQPIQVVLRRQGYEYISLEPQPGAPPQSPKEISETVDVVSKTDKKSLEKLAYQSKDEENPFISWTLFSSAGDIRKHISIVTRETDNALAFKLATDAPSELVGVNKSSRTLHGKVEFEYKVERSDSDGPNMFFYVIPMQETGIGREGLIEVGTNIQDDSRNAFSPYRVKFLVPTKHYGDGEWHGGSIEFDFRETPEAFYSIFAPRINEGSVHPGAGILLVANVSIYSSEG
jgi:energy-coupling factor transporter transmembrane protein EcfT